MGLLAGSFVAAAAGIMSKQKEPWDTELPAASVLLAPAWPENFPLTEVHLKRIDESDDGQFYFHPRLVQHIDEAAIERLGKYYAEILPKGGEVLDLMSSWTSHLAEGAGRDKSEGHFKRVSALGMHMDELGKNPALHDFYAHDLNKDPRLFMYPDASFDAVFCSVSVDYLARPLEVFNEIGRILRPGGLAVFTWSNRMFPTKAITAWREASEPGRLWICGCYFHFCRPVFSAPEGFDISPNPGRTDPVYAVTARKLPKPTPTHSEL